MAQQPYMGSGLLFPRLLSTKHYSIDPDVSARAIWQAVRWLGWETFLFMPVRFFYMP
jgi:hypothetical protein